MSTELRRVVVDVDVGIDDYLSLLILLDAESKGLLKIEAILCSMGNSTVVNTCKNTLRLLEIIKRTDIPVYKGASTHILPVSELVVGTHFGKDGFGDLQYDHEPDLSLVRDEPAAVAISRIVKRLPGQVDLICLAPLTNIALASKLDEDFFKNVRGVYIMGGNYEGMGNAGYTAEFNFYVDPEAVYIVLNDCQSPVYILPWETCFQHKISSDWRFKELTKVPNPAFELLTRAENQIRAFYTALTGVSEWITCDPFLVVSYLYPEETVVKCSQHSGTIELHGKYTRGQFVVDREKRKAPNVKIIENVNTEFFKTVVERAIKNVM